MDLKTLFGRTRFCKAPAITLALSVVFLNGCLDIPDTPDDPPEIEHISVYVEQEGIKDSSILKIFPGDTATLKVSVFPRQYKKDFSFEWKRADKTLGTGESYVIPPKTPTKNFPTLLAVYDPLGSETTIPVDVVANTPPQMDSIVSPAAGDTIYGNATMAILFKWYAYDMDLNYGDALNYTLVIDSTRYELGSLNDILQSGFAPGEHSFYVKVTDSYGDCDSVAPQKFYIIDSLGRSP